MLKKRPRALAHSQAEKQPHAAPVGAKAAANPGENARAENHKARAMGPSKQRVNPLRASDAEALALGVDPDVWARVQTCWAGTHDRNEKASLGGYELGMLTRRGLKSLKEGGQLEDGGHRQ